MKINVRFDSNGLKQFFTLHAEKLAMGVVVVCFVALCYWAYGIRPYDKTPDDLQKNTADARVRIENSKVDLAAESVVLPQPDFSVQIEELGRKKIEAQSFRQIAWNHPLFNRKIRRGEPMYLALRELTAHYGHGPVRFKGVDGAGEEIHGVQWIVLTGLVPVVEQENAYRDVFQNALFKDDLKDKPQYAGFEIERAVVDASNPDAEPQFETLNVPLALQNTFLRWKGAGDEVVDAQFREKTLCEPLPPLVDKQHDASVVHPRIPHDEGAVEPVRETKTTEQPASTDQSPEFGRFGASPSRRPQPASTVRQQPVAKQDFDSRMFRFFDCDVEQGMSYRYRVKLVLNNPNYQIPPQYINTPDLASQEHRKAEWSEPCSLATVPRDFFLLAGGVKSATGPNEDKATFIVHKWDSQIAADVSSEFVEQLRGTLVNMTGVKVVATSGTVENPRTRAEVVNFVTNELLADMTGGTTLPGAPPSVKAPAELMFVSPSGRLSVQSQSADAAAYAREKQRMEGKVVQAATTTTTVDKPKNPGDDLINSTKPPTPSILDLPK